MDVWFIIPSIVTMLGVFASVFLIVVVNDGLRCAGFQAGLGCDAWADRLNYLSVN
jgi:hypothetical protein